MTTSLLHLRCEKCGCRSARLLRDDIHQLIMEFSLHEVLDRFAEMTHNQRELSQNEAIATEWNDLCSLLEKATEQALVIAELKHREGDNVWE